jgi:hypothetical protein
VVEKDASGIGKEKELMAGWFLGDLSADSRWLIVASQGEEGAAVAPLSGQGKAFTLAPESPTAAQGVFSPDGLYIAYSSAESGRREVYVRAFPPATGKWQVSTDGGQFPVWRADGKELFYVSLDSRMMSVEVAARESFHAGLPRALFTGIRFARPGHTRATESVRNYDVTADGQRFLISESPEGADGGRLMVVENWFAGIRK